MEKLEYFMNIRIGCSLTWRGQTNWVASNSTKEKEDIRLGCCFRYKTAVLILESSITRMKKDLGSKVSSVPGYQIRTFMGSCLVAGTFT